MFNFKNALFFYKNMLYVFYPLLKLKTYVMHTKYFNKYKFQTIIKQCIRK